MVVRVGLRYQDLKMAEVKIYGIHIAKFCFRWGGGSGCCQQVAFSLSL